jgi:lipoate-protein ligase A
MEKESRLIIIKDDPKSAYFNMCADKYLFLICQKYPFIFLRFYQWITPSISLGISEDPQKTLNFNAIKKNNIEWVKRPTGGRAVLHCNDLTYSCVFSADLSFMGKTLMETYNIISNSIILGLKYFKIDAQKHESPLINISKKSKFPCFLAPNRHEIMVNGKKLIGSAQKRSTSAVLQHGSIPITTEFRNLPDYLLLENTEREKQKFLLSNNCICIKEIIKEYNKNEFIECLIKGFKDYLNLKTKLYFWDTKDLEQIEKLSI